MGHCVGLQISRISRSSKIISLTQRKIYPTQTTTVPPCIHIPHRLGMIVPRLLVQVQIQGNPLNMFFAELSQQGHRVEGVRLQIQARNTF